MKDKLRDIAYEQRTTMQALLERALHEFLQSGKIDHPPEWWPDTDAEKAYLAGVREIMRNESEASGCLCEVVLNLIRVQRITSARK